MPQKCKLHRLQRISVNGKPVYSCMNPGCNYYTREPELLIGKWTCCNFPICTKQIVITNLDIKHQQVKRFLCPDHKLMRKIDREKKMKIKEDVITAEVRNLPN